MVDEAPTRALELFCGIGGFAAAVRDVDVSIAAAIDISPHVLQAYRGTFGHPTLQKNLAHLEPAELEAFGADVWWMSPPCKPFTVRGKQEGLDDHRAEPFLAMLRAIDEVRPRDLGFENVELFEGSEAHARLREVLERCGYAVEERLLCPTELGVPMRRPRFYLTASLEPLRSPRQVARAHSRPLGSYLDDGDDPALRVPDDAIARYGSKFRVIDRDDGEAYTTCFTSGYATSWSYTGSYLACADGHPRKFSPQEIARLLHFPDGIDFPDDFSMKLRWRSVGNSLSVAALREVLRVFPWFDPPLEV